MEYSLDDENTETMSYPVPWNLGLNLVIFLYQGATTYTIRSVVRFPFPYAFQDMLLILDQVV